MSKSDLGWRCTVSTIAALSVGLVGIRGDVPPDQVVLRDGAGAATCIVTEWTASSMTVLVRRPTPPAAELTATLPEGMRDFASRPMSVLLLPPGAGTESASEAPRRPLRLDPTPTYPVVAGALQPNPFITVQFNPNWLVAGTEIVAEQSAKASTGERVATQTRCPVSAADAAHWR